MGEAEKVIFKNKIIVKKRYSRQITYALHSSKVSDRWPIWTYIILQSIVAFIFEINIL